MNARTISIWFADTGTFFGVEPRFTVVDALENLKHRTDLLIERDDAAFEGPVGALRRGMARASNDIVFACSCDLPLLRFDLAIAICEMLEGRPSTLPATKTPGDLSTQTDGSGNVQVPEVAIPVNRFDAAIPSRYKLERISGT